MDDKQIETLDNFIVHASKVIGSLNHYSQFLKMTPREEEARKVALKILNEKIEILENATKMSEVKQVIRVKRIIKEGDR